MLFQEAPDTRDETWIDEKFVKSEDEQSPPTQHQWYWAGKKRKLVILESDISLRNCKKTRID